MPHGAARSPQASGGPVCNHASLHFQGGGVVATDPPVDRPAARYTDDLAQLPGRGLLGAAAHSPALTACGGEEGGGRAPS